MSETSFLNNGMNVLYISLETYQLGGYKIYDADIDPFSKHMHDYTTIIFIDSLLGNCVYEIENTTYEVHSNSLLLIAPQVSHRKILCGETTVQEIHIGVENMPLNNLFPVTSNHAILALDDTIGNLYRNYTSSLYCSPFAENNTPYHLLQTGVFLQLFSLIYYSACLPPSVFSHYSDKTVCLNSKPIEITQILYFFITTHYMENISFSKFAASHYISISYLSKIFKKHYGISPEKMLIKLRMDKAKELLKDPSLTTKLISDTLGYNDSYHFSKLFKKYFGVTPFEYRKNYT